MGGRDAATKATVTERPEKLHPIVVETKRRYRGLKPSESGRMPSNTGLIGPVAGGTVRLHVAPANLDRALRLVDLLVKAAEARGHIVALDSRGEYAGITVARQFVEFQLREETKRFPHVPTPTEERARTRNPYTLIPTWEYRPTSVFTFEVDQHRYDGRRRRWSEGERWKQEDRIDVVLDGIEAVAEALRVARLEAEQRERDRLQHELERLRREEVRQREQERRDQLKREIEAWRFARDIRVFVAEMRGVLREAEIDSMGDGEAHERLDWALRYADQMDPVSKYRKRRLGSDEEG